MYKYNFHGLFSLSTNIPYFEGLLHSFKGESESRIRLQFFLDSKLRISTQGKPHINLMLYHSANDNSVEFAYPWIAPISARLVFGDDGSSYTFRFDRNYLRFSNIVAEGWELMDIFRSLVQLSLIKAGMFMVHGAAISLEEGGILIPSFGNTGKTSTSWMLAKRGAEFLTDEFAIVDSQLNCFGFPCSSLVSSRLIEAAGLRLTRMQSVALRYRDLRSKFLSTRFAPGGIKLYPDEILRVRNKAMIRRIVFIQNGIDACRKITNEEALKLLNAIQDYEVNWKSNPFIIAQSFFRPEFISDNLLSRERKILENLISSVADSYLVSSSKGLHFQLIERLPLMPQRAESSGSG